MTAIAKTFAHLLSGKPKSDAADPEKDANKTATATSAEDDKEPPKDDKEDGKGKKGKKAEDEDKDKDASGEDDDENMEDEDDKEKAERAELNGTSPVAQARDRERARCGAIFASTHATGRVAAAAQLAFNTRMTSSEAIATLEVLPSDAGKKGRLNEAMNTAPNPKGVGTSSPDAGAAADANAPSALAKKIVEAGKYRRGEV